MTQPAINTNNTAAPIGAPVAVVDRPDAPAVRLDPAFTAAPPAALAIVPPATAAVPVVVQGIEFTPERVALLKRTIAKNSTDDELELFLYTCRRLRLDPFARQIYFMKRKRGSDDADSGSGEDTGRAQVSIDGLRLIAERTGDYQGQTKPQWANVTLSEHGPVVDWYDVWPFATHPHSARIGVYRRGFAEPMYGVARFDAYKVTKGSGGLNRMWSKMGPEQLVKCAEALALRKAFPQELSGVYTPDEMEQADNDERDDEPRREPRARAEKTPRAEAKRDAKADTNAAEPAEPAAPAHRTTQKFPFDPRRGVLLDERYPAGHEHAGGYVVSVDLLTRAYAWAEDCLGGKPFARAGSTDKVPLMKDERPKFERMRDALLAELEARQQEEADRAATAPPAEPDGPPSAGSGDGTAVDAAREQLAEEAGEAAGEFDERDAGDGSAPY